MLIEELRLHKKNKQITDIRIFMPIEWHTGWRSFQTLNGSLVAYFYNTAIPLQFTHRPTEVRFPAFWPRVSAWFMLIKLSVMKGQVIIRPHYCTRSSLESSQAGYIRLLWALNIFSELHHLAFNLKTKTRVGASRWIIKILFIKSWSRPFPVGNRFTASFWVFQPWK